MHLIDSTKIGIALPSTLPAEIIPPNLRSSALVRSDSTGSRGRSDSVSEGAQAAGMFTFNILVNACKNLTQNKFNSSNLSNF